MGAACGGVLIERDIVLFNAQCGDLKDQQVIVGAYTQYTLEEGAHDRFCEEWIGDPNHDSATFDYDFALCKLNLPVDIDTSKVTLELNDDSSFLSDDDDLIVMGFGKEDHCGYDPNFLYTVTVPYITNERCNAIEREAYENEITDQMLCAGFLEPHKKDSCKGDGGGPIVKRTENADGTFVDTVVGVVSWGAGCGRRDRPGVYARVSSRIDWIRDTLCDTLDSVYCQSATSEYTSSPSLCSDEFVITVKTNDFWAHETSWTLTDSNENVVLSRRYLVNWHQNEHTLCLEANECFSFTISDSGNNGMCDDYSCGSYSIKLNGSQVVFEEENFGSSKTIEICNTSTSPSMSPSMSPSINLYGPSYFDPSYFDPS